MVARGVPYPSYELARRVRGAVAVTAAGLNAKWGVVRRTRGGLREPFDGADGPNARVVGWGKR